MIEPEIINEHIRNLMKTLTSIRANIHELSESDKAISNQIMILENVKTHIDSLQPNIPSFDAPEGIKDK